MLQLENTVLYYKPTCPYCMKVISYMQNHDIACEKKNVMQEDLRDELIEIGGKGQVPCLVIDGKPMYESDDIIAYMSTLVEA